MIEGQKIHKKSLSTRKLLWNISDHRCPLCGVTMVNKGKSDVANFATIDHIIPKSRGGTGNFENLRLICRKCNNKRGNKIEDDTLYYKDIHGKYIVVKNC